MKNRKIEELPEGFEWERFEFFDQDDQEMIEKWVGFQQNQVKVHIFDSKHGGFEEVLLNLGKSWTSMDFDEFKRIAKLMSFE